MNGEAERFVQTFKSGIRRAQSTDVDQALAQFLLRYRTTPHATTGKTPAEMMFGRRVRTRLDLLHPTSNLTKISPTKADLQSGSTQNHLRKFQVGTHVWMRNYVGKPKWIPGVVKTKTGPVSYKICARGSIHRRHIDQLRMRNLPCPRNLENQEDPEQFLMFPGSGERSTVHLPVPERQPDFPVVGRYVLRQNRSPPERYGQ